MRKIFTLVILLIFTCKELRSQTLIYSQDFGVTFPPAGWKLIQAGSGNQWTGTTTTPQSGAYAMRYVHNTANAANCWAISTGISMVAGNTYYVTYYQKTDNDIFLDYAESMSVTVGNAQTVAAQTTVLQTLTDVRNTTYAKRQTGYFTPAISGIYYFGFHCTSNADQFNLYVDNINVYQSTVSCAGGTNILTVNDGDYLYWGSANWSKGHVPLPCEDVLITYTSAAGVHTGVVNIDMPININSLTENGSWSGSGQKQLYLQETGNLPIHLTGNLSMSSTGGSSLNQVIFISSTTSCTIDGTTTIGQPSDTKYCDFGGEATNNPVITFNGDVTFNTGGYTSYPGTYIFNKTGSQILTNNSTQTITSPAGSLVNFQNVVVGNSGATALTVAGSATSNQQRVLDGSLTVNSGSSLILPSGYTFNRSVATTGATGTLSLSNTALLQSGGATGGQTGSNFPKNYSTYSLGTTSTVEYNGTSAQTVYAAPDYGNLTLTNASAKTAGGALTINGNVLINPSAIFSASAAGAGIKVAGNWTNNGTYTAQMNRVTFNGLSGTQTLSGNTMFYDLTLNNTGAVTDFGTTTTTIADNLTTSSGTMNGNTSLIIFTGASGSMAGATSKNFYNLQINGGANITHSIGGSNMHVDNSYLNNGSFTQNSTYTTYFDKSGGTPFLSGSGTTTFGNIVIGKSGAIGSGTTLNANSHSFTVSGTAFTFNHNGSVFNGGTSTVTFNGITDLIGNASTVTGTIASFYGVTALNTTTLGMNAIVNGTLLITNPGNTFIINGNTLTLNGTITGSGTLTGSSTSNLTIGSSGYLGTAYFNQTTNNTTNALKDFIINSGASITIGNVLNITAGTAANTYGTVTANGALNANGNLILKSNQYGDAIVGLSSGIILNNATVERYIPARRAWRFLSVPIKISSTQTINAVWQEGAAPNIDIYTHNNPNPGYGTEITYDNNTAHGFDVNTTTNPSIKVWDVNTNNWSPTIPFTNTTYITDYPAYCLFVRGSRAVDLSQGIYAPIDNTVLRITGNLNAGGFSKNYTTVGGNAVLVSNPYASPINILSVLAANTLKFTNNKFWVWDPAYSGGYGVGGYITYNNGLMVPAGSTYSGSFYAQSGQAFMLEATTTGLTGISFAESNKVAPETNVFGKAMRQHYPAIYTNLMVPSADSLILVDGVGAAFANRFSASVDADDAKKQWNFNENIALVRNEHRLAIEMRPIPKLTDTLFFKLFLKHQTYMLQIFSENLPANLPAQARLIDKYLNTETAVDVYDTTLYSFTANSDTNSYRNRFMLVFNRKLKATPVSANNIYSTSTANNESSIAIKQNKINIYPNPVTTGEKIVLKFSNVAKGNYELTITNNLGKVFTVKTIVHDGGSNIYSLKTNAGWAAGNYLVKISGENGFDFLNKLVIAK